MLKTISACSLGIGMILLLAGSAFGQGENESEDFARPGFYVGLGATLAVENVDLDEAAEKSKVDIDMEDTSPGLDVRAGYRIHPNFAAEVHFQRYAGFDFEVDGEGTAETEVDMWSLTADLKAYPLTGRFQPYGLVGIGNLRVELDDNLSEELEVPLDIPKSESTFSARFGVGVDFYLARHSLIYVESTYIYPMGGDDDFDIIPVAVGIQYRLN